MFSYVIFFLSTTWSYLHTPSSFNQIANINIPRSQELHSKRNSVSHSIAIVYYLKFRPLNVTRDNRSLASVIIALCSLCDNNLGFCPIHYFYSFNQCFSPLWGDSPRSQGHHDRPKEIPWIKKSKYIDLKRSVEWLPFSEIGYGA